MDETQNHLFSRGMIGGSFALPSKGEQFEGKCQVQHHGGVDVRQDLDIVNRELRACVENSDRQRINSQIDHETLSQRINSQIDHDALSQRINSQIDHDSLNQRISSQIDHDSLNKSPKNGPNFPPVKPPHAAELSEFFMYSSANPKLNLESIYGIREPSKLHQDLLYDTQDGKGGMNLSKDHMGEGMSGHSLYDPEVFKTSFTALNSGTPLPGTSEGNLE